MTITLPIQLSQSDFVVSTHGLGKHYGARVALRDVALQVPEGAVYAMIGANGAGKSTIFKTVLNLIRAEAGTAEVFGMDTRRHGPYIRSNVGYVPESLHWGYGKMRVGQLLHHHAHYFPTWEAPYAARLVKAFRLQLDQRMNTLSKGQVRRVHMIMALAHRPPLLLLDEPTDGLDPLIRDETIRILVDHLSESSTTVLLATHHAEEIEHIADHIGVMAAGELRAQVPVDVLRHNLRRYRMGVSEGWTETPALKQRTLSHSETGRERQFVI